MFLASLFKVLCLRALLCTHHLKLRQLCEDSNESSRYLQKCVYKLPGSLVPAADTRLALKLILQIHKLLWNSEAEGSDTQNWQERTTCHKVRLLRHVSSAAVGHKSGIAHVTKTTAGVQQACTGWACIKANVSLQTDKPVLIKQHFFIPLSLN